MNNKKSLTFPKIGLGTYKLVDRLELERVLDTALNTGYRYIDTAAYYHNEDIIGRFLDKHHCRDEVMIATKLWPNVYKKDIDREMEKAFDKLRTDYIDLVLLHWPGDGDRHVYEVLWRYADAGRIGGVGICNYHAHHIDALLEKGAPAPLLNQVEMHIGLPQKSLCQMMSEKRILMQAWAPLARHDAALIQHPAVLKAAKRYGASPAQIALAYLSQKGVMPLPKSAHPERVIENYRAMDLVLDEHICRELEAIGNDRRLSHDPDDRSWIQKISQEEQA